MRRAGAAAAANRCQAVTRATTAAMRCSSARWAKRENCRSGSRRSGDLKLATPAKMRPSTSGSTTCIARSAGDKPRTAAAQSRLRAVDSATWKTGQPGASSGEFPSSPRAEKAVALTTAIGCIRCRASPIQRAAAGAFSDGTKRPTDAKSCALNAPISASTGPVSAAVT